MSIPHHNTLHLDDEVAFWIVAHVHKLDTHARWSAEWHSRRDGATDKSSGWLFRDYECSAEVLREFVNRGLVTSSVAATPERSIDDEIRELHQEREEPNRAVWFELVIDTFTEQAVKFSFSLQAYKYHMPSASLPKQFYYQFADRLSAKVRFVHEWFALESLTTRLRGALHRGAILPRVAEALEHELTLLRAPSELQIQSSCRSLFPLVERAMRDHIESASTTAKARTLDDLIRRFEESRIVAPETIELLRFVTKPTRDYFEHGRSLPTPMAKLVLSTLLEVFVRLGDVGA
jgi:hypothetical protein